MSCSFSIQAKQKFVRQKVRKYGLASQRKIPSFKAEELLKENGFVITDKNKNCLFVNGGKETMKHWLVKAMIFKILRERGRNVGTEIEMKEGIADVIDIDNKIVYEIESEPTKKKIKEKLKLFNGADDVFILDLKKFPNDIIEAEKYLKEKIV